MANAETLQRMNEILNGKRIMSANARCKVLRREGNKSTYPVVFYQENPASIEEGVENQIIAPTPFVVEKGVDAWCTRCGKNCGEAKVTSVLNTNLSGLQRTIVNFEPVKLGQRPHTASRTGSISAIQNVPDTTGL